MYPMSEGLAVAQRASREIEAWLRSLPGTRAVRNVEDDAAYRRIDVDVLWTTDRRTWQVEIKGDRLHRTGNFFFETHSNRERGTPGCFLYTEADLLFYYFVVPHDLYILPMPETRDWFVPRLGTFREATTTTPVGRQRYTTVGRLVPIGTVERAVPSIRHYRLPAPAREAE